MQRTIAVLVAACALAGPVLAADLKKGETVYLAAVLPAVKQPMRGGSKAPDLDVLPACAPLKVERRYMGNWAMRQEDQAQRWIAPDLAALALASRDECLAAAQVQVEILWDGWGVIPTHHLVAPKPEHP